MRTEPYTWARFRMTRGLRFLWNRAGAQVRAPGGATVPHLQRLRRLYDRKGVMVRLLRLEAEREAAAERAGGLDDVHGTPIRAESGNVALGQQVTDINQGIHFGGNE